MKKILIIVCVLITLALSACSPNIESGLETEPTEEREELRLTESSFNRFDWSGFGAGQADALVDYVDLVLTGTVISEGRFEWLEIEHSGDGTLLWPVMVYEIEVGRAYKGNEEEIRNYNGSTEGRLRIKTHTNYVGEHHWLMDIATEPLEVGTEYLFVLGMFDHTQAYDPSLYIPREPLFMPGPPNPWQGVYRLDTGRGQDVIYADPDGVIGTFENDNPITAGEILALFE